MNRHSVRSLSGLSRRAALGRVAAVGAAIGLGSRLKVATAQDATPAAMAAHPIVGAWNSTTPGGPSLAIFHADGTATFVDTASSVDPAMGLVLRTLGIGAWEPTGERSVHFTSTEFISDINGTFLGYGTVDGYPEVDADGESLHDDQSQVKITIRDAAGAVVQEISAAGAPPVIGRRVRVGNPGFPTSAPAATPTS